MPVKLKVKDMMIPIDDYAVTTTDKPLKEAIPQIKMGGGVAGIDINNRIQS